VSLALFSILISMMPLGLSADTLPMPDLVFALAFAWVIRSPSTAPLGVVVAVALLSDVLLMRPLGLWTLVIIIVTEFARAQRIPLRAQMLVVEWSIFAIAMALGLALNGMILSTTFTPRPGFDLVFNYWLISVVAYPVVCGLLHWVFRIRAPLVSATSDRLGRVI